MIDESTDFCASGHLVMFAMIIEEGLPIIVFLCVLQLPGDKKDVATIFDYVIY